jgi:hypothetical protein
VARADDDEVVGHDEHLHSIAYRAESSPMPLCGWLRVRDQRLSDGFDYLVNA